MDIKEGNERETWLLFGELQGCCPHPGTDGDDDHPITSPGRGTETFYRQIL